MKKLDLPDMSAPKDLSFRTVGRQPVERRPVLPGSFVPAASAFEEDPESVRRFCPATRAVPTTIEDVADLLREWGVQ